MSCGLGNEIRWSGWPNVQATAAGGAKVRETFTIKEGETIERFLKLTAPPTPSASVGPEPVPVAKVSLAPPPVSAGDPPKPPSRTLAWTLGGIGGAAMAVSLVAGGLAMKKRAVVSDHCPDRKCDEEGLAAGSSGATLVTTANVAFVIGVLGIGSAGWLLVQKEPGGASVSLSARLP